MQDHTTYPNVCKTYRDLLLRALSTIGDKIFGRDDCRARNRGWQITARHGGLSRTYRDPRFDYLFTCPACGGRGHNPDRATCSSCDGSGRTVLDWAETAQPRQGQQERGRP